MRKKLTKTDIERIVYKEHSRVVDNLIEKLVMFSGSGKNKKPLLSKGLKIKHDKSGLVYTVTKLMKIDGKDFVVCKKPNGKFIKISASEIKKDYSRL